MAEPTHDRASNIAVGRGVVQGAFALLEELARVGEAGLTRLAAGAGLPKATAYRLLTQLVAVGAVRRQAGRYRIGPQMFRLGRTWQPDPVLRAAAQHPLRELATATGACASVAVPDAGRALTIGGIRGELADVLELRAGMVHPPGSANHMILTTVTSGTAPPEYYSMPEWKRLVTRAREQGLALDHRTIPPLYLSCAAAPVHAPSGKIVAAVSAVVLDGRRLRSTVASVHRAARMVSANLSRRQPVP